MKQFNSLNQQAGVGFIEILITVVIIAIGLLGIAVSQAVAIKETGNSAQRTAATFMMTDMIERMHMNRGAIKDYMSAINGNCPTTPAKSCGAGVESGDVKLGEQCTSAEKAAYDLWDVKCSHGNKDVNGKGKSGNYDYMASSVLSMRCVDVGPPVVLKTTCDVGDTVELRLQWRESDNDRKTSASRTQFITMRSPL